MRRLAILAAVLGAGCVTPLEPVPPTSELELLYAEVVSCSGLPARPMPAVYYLPADPETGGFDCTSPEGCLGSWVPGAIYLADSPGGRAAFSFRHEALHELLEGDPAHSSPAWALCGLRPEDQPIVLVLR